MTTFRYWNYQLFFALLFMLGEPVGGWVLRTILKDLYRHRDINEIGPRMAYPYYHLYFGKTAFNAKIGYPHDPSSDLFRPTFFAYGWAKEFMFHDISSLDQLRHLENKGCKVDAYQTDHWIQVE